MKSEQRNDKTQNIEHMKKKNVKLHRTERKKNNYSVENIFFPIVDLI